MFQGFHGIDVLATAFPAQLHDDAGETVLHAERGGIGGYCICADVAKSCAIAARDDIPGCIEETALQMCSPTELLYVTRCDGRPLPFQRIDHGSSRKPMQCPPTSSVTGLVCSSAEE